MVLLNNKSILLNLIFKLFNGKLGISFRQNIKIFCSTLFYEAHFKNHGNGYFIIYFLLHFIYTVVSLIIESIAAHSISILSIFFTIIYLIV